MDRDKFMEEIMSLQKLLANTDPETDKYEKITRRLLELGKFLMDYDECCDKQLERQNKHELEREKITKELELKIKELELKMDLDRLKIEENSAEAKARRKAEKRQALWDLLKLILQLLGSGVLIVVTGRIEQTVILGQHKWSLIPKLKG